MKGGIIPGGRNFIMTSGGTIGGKMKGRRDTFAISSRKRAYSGKHPSLDYNSSSGSVVMLKLNCSSKLCSRIEMK